MSHYLLSERRAPVCGVAGRFFNLISRDARLWLSQVWISEGRADGRIRQSYGARAKLHASLRFDDSCGNGRNSFSVTAEISGAARSCDDGSIGCAHEDVARLFPELAHLVRWHLFDTSGPMHYAANAVYLAGDRDHNGLRKGERRQIINGRTKLPAWRLEAVNAPDLALKTPRDGSEGETVPLYRVGDSVDCDACELPAVPVLRWVPWETIGEGKARELDAARRVAVWPDATDEELSAEPAELRAALMERLPALVAAFESDVRAAGFAWAPAELEGASDA